MEPETLVLGLTGDVMIGRSVDPVISQEGYDYVWGDVLPLLRATDVNLINLETTLTRSTKSRPKVFHFKASPDKVNALTRAHVTVANLANNHLLDYDGQGLEETCHTLREAGILFTGAGLNYLEAARPAILHAGIFRIGVLGMTDNEPGWAAGPDTPGIHYVNVEDRGSRELVIAAMKTLRRQTDLAIASIHWGPNGRERPSASFIRFAHELVDAGTDIVHGHSAHIFQGIEIYQSRLILYDTGDFVDDYAVDPDLRNDLSFLYRVRVSARGPESLMLTPVRIGAYQVNLARGAEAAWSLRRIRQLSSALGTDIPASGELPIRTG
ncbi:MAG TPA: CapA family protein [Chitinophagaceae bacterium]|nr:CapA family protein [Chitinophagaceae bacterium]